MRVFVLLLMLFGSNLAELISIDKVENLFKKYVRNEMNDDDQKLFQDVIEILHRPEYVSDRILDSNISSSRTSLDCVICRSVFASAFDAIKSGQSNQQLGDTLTRLCTIIGIQNNAVCEGAIKLNLPIVHYIIENSPEATPAAFCGLMLQNAHNPNVCPFQDDRFEWQVWLPPRPAIVPAPYTADKSVKVAVMTDFHIDPLYEVFGVADCDEPTCCRKGQSPRISFDYNFDTEENVISRSIHNDSGVLQLDLDQAPKLRQMRSMERTRFPGSRNSPPAGYWGDYRNCDTPIHAFDDAIDRVVENHKDIDLVYYIGDTIDHFVWETTYELINDVNRYAIDKLRKSFGDNVIVMPAIGNHESQPTNQFAPEYVKGEYLNTTWLYEALARKWGHYLPEEALESFKKRGDYSVLARPGLRVISLNNNVAYRDNWWLVYDPLDPKRHLDWLVMELSKAELAGEKVHILAHIPPGVHDLIYTWTREYNKIVNRFSATIAAEFNGHTHSDEFKLFYSLVDGRPINVAWGGGSLTSYTFYNLNYKIATLGANYEPTSIINYVYNLTEANLTPEHRPRWFQLYDMTKTFGLLDLSARSMDNLVYRMVTTDRHLLDIYSAFFSKVSDYRWSWCGDECKLDNVCKAVVSVLWERERCQTLRELFLLRK